MRLLPRSVRTRLVVVFAIGASCLLVLCLALLHLTLDRRLRDALDADLAGRGNDLGASIDAGDLAAVAGDPMAQLYAADGTVLASSTALAGHRLLDTGQVTAVHGRNLTDRNLPLGHHDAPVQVRLLSRPVGPAGQVLAVGAATAVVEQASDQQLEVLSMAAPLLVAALAAVCWLLVRAALRPVDALTREAAAISTLAPGRRLPRIPGNDEIARLAATLDDMLARLAVAFARERAFVDDASHELRTPIAVLGGEIDLALGALDDRAEVEQSLLAARGQVTRLTRLAEDLLLLARERAGSLVVARQPVDLTELVLAEVQTTGPALGLRTTVVGEPVVVEADPLRLRQVLTNLAANSTAAGARSVRIHTSRTRGAVTIEWADDGPGFPPALLDSAFERFVRGDTARTGTSGAGLGLSIVAAIVAAHGGRTQLHNGPPLGGAVVTVHLPLA